MDDASTAAVGIAPAVTRWWPSSPSCSAALAFAFKNQAAGRRHRKCKACMAAYGRQHYARHREAYIARNVSNMRLRRRSLKAQVWVYLAEHPCVDCGEGDLVVLNVDHVDPATKRSEIHWLVQKAYRWSTILAEIAKCEVRCANCHRRRTAVQFAWRTRTVGTDWRARTPRAHLRRPASRRRDPASAALDSILVHAGYRLCRWCGAQKPVEQFHLHDKAHGYRQSVCADCFTAYRREHYRLNRADYVRRNARLVRLRAWNSLGRLWEHLLTDAGPADTRVRSSRSPHEDAGRWVYRAGRLSVASSRNRTRQVRRALRELPPTPNGHSIQLAETRCAAIL